MDRKGANKNHLKCCIYSNDCNNNFTAAITTKDNKS